MKYYKIESGIANPYTICELPSLPRKTWRDSVSFRNGTAITVPVPCPLIYKINHPESREPEPFLEAIYPVVDKTVLQAFVEAGVDNFQLFPAVLESEKTGKTWAGYYALNVIGLRNCVLLNESEHDTIAEGSAGIPSVMGFNSYVFSGAKLADNPLMFRLEQDHSLFISEHVMQTLENIMPLKDWNISATEIEVK